MEVWNPQYICEAEEKPLYFIMHWEKTEWSPEKSRTESHTDSK